MMNQALVYCGISQKIEDESDTPFARNIVAMFDGVFDDIASESEWNFTISFQELSQIDETPIDKNYLYSYQVPSDVLVIKGLIGKNTGDKIYDYQIVYKSSTETKIFTNEENIILRYVRDVDAGAISGVFASYIAAQLAYECANALVVDTKKLGKVEKIRNEKRAAAMFADAQEQPLGGLDTDSSIENARYNFGTGYWGI